MNQVQPLPRPPVTPQATVVLAPVYAMTALATGMQVEVRAKPLRRPVPCS